MNRHLPRHWQNHPFPQLAHTRIASPTAEYRAEAAPYLAKARLNGAEHHRFAHILCADDGEAAQQAHYRRHLCAAARLGNAAALYDLACYFRGGYPDLAQIVAPDAALAERLMDLAVRKGYPHALFERAWQHLYHTGDSARGREYLLRAAAGRSQAALLLLADCHARGRFGFRRSRRLATFYKKSAWRDDVLGT
ncbi:hypothetical protein [Conchiformibius kuhniae]|uniref:Sel1 repeat family protein n=1 Tax=Conchiformibius kuhniae TaxID=211502 RepID=A0A8T9MZ91_9NEIS|nr:hypothetical protein [Conchiformibius kuhniae]UOP05512.1 hypothetical protein LVJ77_05135 [Conchiformibius kuhniae]